MLLYIASDTFSVLGQAARVYLRGCPSIFGDSLFILFLIHLREHLNSLLTLIFKLHLLLANHPWLFPSCVLPSGCITGQVAIVVILVDSWLLPD